MKNSMANQDAINLIKQRAGGNKDKKMEKILCPMCGKTLVKKMIPGKGEGFVHERATTKCNARYKNLAEIEVARFDKRKEETSFEETTVKENIKPETKTFSSQVEITHTITKTQYEGGYYPETGEEISPALENKQLIEEKRFLTIENALTEPQIEKKNTPEEKEMDFSGEMSLKEDQFGQMESLRKEPRMKQLDKTMKVPTTVSSQEPKEMRATIIKKIVYESVDPVAGETGEYKNRLEEIGTQVETEKSKTAEEIEYESYGKTQLLSIPADEKECPTLVEKSTGEIIEINQPVFLIGKTSKCQLRVEDNNAVSRKHAEILLKNDTVYVRDKGSANGTFINSMKLPEETEVELKDGQELKISNIVYVFNK